MSSDHGRHVRFARHHPAMSKAGAFEAAKAAEIERRK
jgi:hypothetical protein